MFVKRHPIATVLVVLLLVWSFFARPVYDFLWIVTWRVKDQAMNKWGKPLLRRDHAEAMDAATVQANQIDRYLRGLRAAGDLPLQRADFSGVDAYVHSLDELRGHLRASLRYPPPGAETTKAELVEETPLGEDALATYTRLRIRVLPGVESIGVYMRPKNLRPGRSPLVISAHGRSDAPDAGPDGKQVILTHSNRDIARGALERGYLVWAPTFVFYATNQPDTIRERLAARATEAGTTLAAVEIAKVIGSLDVVIQRPEVDPVRVGMIGMSYGGFYTLYTTALEPRIKAAVVGGYFNDREAILDDSEPFGLFDWRFSDSLGWLRDPNIAALICPRPLLIEDGEYDQIFPIAGARRAAPQAGEFYRRLKVEDRFRFLEFTGRHDFDGKEAWDFLDRWL